MPIADFGENVIHFVLRQCIRQRSSNRFVEESMRTRFVWALALSTLALSSFAGDAKAKAAKSADESADSAPGGVMDFGSSWAQGGPYTLANLKGKVVVLCYFSEG
jgi:cytochrome oxidase Cu insertion factor (SCO1/SenC/PrrC family)